MIRRTYADAGGVREEMWENMVSSVSRDMRVIDVRGLRVDEVKEAAVRPVDAAVDLLRM